MKRSPPTGNIVSDNDSSCAFTKSTDDDSIVPAAANDPFISEVGRFCQSSKINEGASSVPT